MIGVIIILGIIIGYFIYKNQRQRKYVQSTLNLIRSRNNFHPDYYQIMVANSGAIALDVSQKMICVIDETAVAHYLISENIHGVEIILEEEVERGKNKVKGLVKYYLYKSILGDTSANLSVQLARIKEFKKVKSLKVKISTTNLHRPNLYLNFLERGKMKQKEAVMNNIHDWVTRIETIKNDQQNSLGNPLLRGFNF